MFVRMGRGLRRSFRQLADMPRPEGATVGPAAASGTTVAQQPLDAADSAGTAGKRIAWAFAATCFAVALALPGSVFSDSELELYWPSKIEDVTDGILNLIAGVLQLHWVAALLVIAPFAITAIILLDLKPTRTRGQRLSLVVNDPVLGSVSAQHAADDQMRWRNRRQAIEISFEYERDRIRWLLCRLALQAYVLADIATFALTCTLLIARAQGFASESTAVRVACSVAAATTTAFLANLARVMLRISGGDVTTRTFSWAFRSVVLVIIADVGLYALFEKELTGILQTLLLGIFVGATGDHAIQFVLDRAGKIFNPGAGEAQKLSPLLDIDGVTAAHIERLEEEGIVSIHDLAFVPTARLFFSTAYSLQQICDWQDRALLLVYVGKKSADALAEKMNIRGAIDLQAFAHRILFEDDASGTAAIKTSLGTALQLDAGAIEAMLASMAHDEVVMRIRYYWGGVVSPHHPGPPPARAARRDPPEIITMSELTPSSGQVPPAAPGQQPPPAALPASRGPSGSSPPPNGG